MQAQDGKLISIERVVAFVLGPIVIAASGTLSAAAVKWGFNVSPKVIEGAFVTGGLTAGALAWKWLHGRQVYETVEHDLQGIAGVGGSDLIHATLKDLEGLAQHAAENAVAKATAPKAADLATAPQGAQGDAPPDQEPIPPAADPAPTSRGQVAEQADVGAASGQ